MISEVIEKLKLPIVLFLTKIVDEDNFLVFKPSKLGSPSNYGYLIRWMFNYCREHVRNPLLPRDKEIKERRRALKIALKVP